jgi:CDP-paratose 2-epimerase
MKILITGGAGFIGTHLAVRFSRSGHSLAVYDNLSRKGAAENLQWLRTQLPGVEFIHADVRDFGALERAARDRDAIFHLAAQVAVTSSVTSPREDFEINALGTFNVLEAARLSGRSPIVIYSSTNKVYGALQGARVIPEETRYRFADLPYGVSEEWPVDFHSPYGCSKGAGDQYVRDYARIYGLPTVVFRQSCIYGERQFGVEDQGWLAHFVISVLLGRRITIYGDGRQVRDILYIDDLVAAFERAVERIGQVRGEVFNLGGGPENTLSVWNETGPLLARLAGRPLEVERGSWRPGDQKVYVSDVRKAARLLDWKSTIPPPEGLGRLWEWARANQTLFAG